MVFSQSNNKAIFVIITVFIVQWFTVGSECGRVKRIVGGTEVECGTKSFTYL